MSRFWLHNFGCRANQADGAALTAALTRRGWTPAGEAHADWAVLNTCTVTAEADAEARRVIARLRREHPGLRIAVTGCYARRAPAEVEALDGVDAIFGADGPGAGVFGSGSPKLTTESVFENLEAWNEPPAPPAANAGRTRPVVRVQDGCSRRCSYCVVPFVRGAHRSLPLGGVLAHIAGLVAAGFPEVVISGINLGEWGRDLDGHLRLHHLARAILEQTALPRLRLSSVEPVDWSGELTELLATEPRLAAHAHLPLQSGSDGVLARMHRRYTASGYAERVLALRRRAPEAAIGADVMTGFPGETETEFLETRAFVAAMPFTYLHIFTFSSRQGTEAARQLASGHWPSVPPQAAHERAQELRRLIAGKRAAFLNQMIGRTLQVVTLKPGADGAGRGLTGNFLEMALPPAPARQLAAAAVIGVRAGRLMGAWAA
jgi:threonylcarbamoyladenosine tRNA methylthiotransferase MtaB